MQKSTSIIGKNLTCTNIVLIKSSENVCLKVNKEGYLTTVMTVPVRAILLPRKLPGRFYKLDFIGLLCLRRLIPCANNATNAKG